MFHNNAAYILDGKRFFNLPCITFVLKISMSTLSNRKSFHEINFHYNK